MRLFGYESDDGSDALAVDLGDRLLPLEGRLEALLRASDWRSDIERRKTIIDGEPGFDKASVRPAAPLPRPNKIVCVGLNYGAHAAEGGRDAPSHPLLFAKFANAVVADGRPVVRPEGTDALDLEVELGVVIGRRARRVSLADAMDHVAGYVVVNDISARDWQGSSPALKPGQKGDGQWLRAKGSDTFLPMGQVFVSADALDPKAGLRLRSWRITTDGTEHLMQDSSTNDLIFDVPTLVSLISRTITLEPGDLIATGTPAGVGVFRDPPIFLEPGWRVRCEIEGIGRVENPIIDWTDRPPDPEHDA